MDEHPAAFQNAKRGDAAAQGFGAAQDQTKGCRT
jgi:hypothetical protein